MSKLMKVDFYKVVMPENAACKFDEILDRISAIPADDHRNVVRAGYPIRLQEATKGGAVWEGEFVRIRMDEIPVKASLGGAIEPIELEDDEGIGEETAFLR